MAPRKLYKVKTLPTPISKLKRSELLTTNQLSAMLGYKSQTLRLWRLNGTHIPYYKTPHGRIFYKLCDALEWMNGCYRGVNTIMTVQRPSTKGRKRGRK